MKWWTLPLIFTACLLTAPMVHALDARGAVERADAVDASLRFLDGDVCTRLAFSRDCRGFVTANMRGAGSYEMLLPGTPTAHAIADLDSDSNLEAVIAWRDELMNGGLDVITFDCASPCAPSRRTTFAAPLFSPFLVRIFDIDNDGANEVIVGSYDRAIGGRDGFTRKFQIFKFDGRHLVPLWFSERWFDDLAVARVFGVHYLAELRRDESGDRIALFRWDGFGLWKEREFYSARRVRFLRHNEGVLIDGGGGKYLEFAGKEGKIVLTRYHGRMR